MTYDPCKANIYSMCPVQSTVPITAFAVIPIARSDVSGIPSIALGIPDFEGHARLRVFANSTKTEIGCVQAVMTNGQTLSQPKAVGSFLGVMTFFAMLGSFLAAIYGLSVTHMRTHYAHSFSVLVIIETFQSIFFSGAVTVNWPSVLPAWWSNFAWSGGMFISDSLVRSISSFTGNEATATQVGGAGSDTVNTNGGLAQQIYGRSLMKRARELNVSATSIITKRGSYNPNDPYDYNWNGGPRAPGMPMPGTWPGLAGTLSIINIPPAEAFTLALIWLMVILGAVALFILLTKLVLDLCIRFKLLKTDGFDYFRAHYLGYLASALLRTLFIAFFVIMTLALYQFSLHGPAGPTAIAAIVFLLFFVGMGGIAAYACHFRLRNGKFEAGKDTLRIESGKIFKKVPFISATRESSIGEKETAERPKLLSAVPIVSIRYKDNDPDRTTVHQDEGFIKRFGWLSARYRRRSWWFFLYYLGYQFVRACFLGAGSKSPLAQVYGMFLLEVIAAVVIIKLRPFESSRNASVAVWMLSISKVVTSGISIAFLPDFSVNRIVATVLGIIIVVVQGFLAVAVLILIVIGFFSTWMSLSRNREEFTESLSQARISYFEHVEKRAKDLPPEPKVVEVPEEIVPYFNVKEVRRAPKIEDDDENDDLAEMEPAAHITELPLAAGRRSRANSASSRYSVSSIPRAARVHRPSWSSKEFAQMQAEMLSRPESQRLGHHSRSSSLRLSSNAIPSFPSDPTGVSTPTRRPMTPARESFEEQASRAVPAQASEPTEPTTSEDEKAKPTEATAEQTKEEDKN